MRKQKRILAAALTVVFLCSFLTATALAVTDAEVEAQVAAQGKEAVTGNIFIWFLCAISFLKISQKIDSFMASLGVNVGRTGGSMLSEILVATRGISIGKNMFGGGNGGAPSSGGASGSSGSGSGGGRNGGSPGFLSGGLMGVASRGIQNGAVANATDSSGGGLGGMMFQSSLNKGGDYANSIVSSVAHGSRAQQGTISGAKAATALSSYMHVGGAANTVNAAAHSDGDSVSLNQNEGGSTVNVSENAPIPSAQDASAASGGAAEGTDIPFSPSAAPEGASIPSSPSAAGAIQYSDVEIGGGRITGIESSEGPEPREFAMYSTAQYTQPQGHYDTVTAVDNSKWYRQYAQAAVDRTPYEAPDGGVSYGEQIVQRLPPTPRRKDNL